MFAYTHTENLDSSILPPPSYCHAPSLLNTQPVCFLPIPFYSGFSCVSTGNIYGFKYVFMSMWNLLFFFHAVYLELYPCLQTSIWLTFICCLVVHATAEPQFNHSPVVGHLGCFLVVFAMTVVLQHTSLNILPCASVKMFLWRWEGELLDH